MNAWIVDAFADGHYAGNPAAVVVADGFPPQEAMQAIAARLDVPTTAFVTRIALARYKIRWFTPRAELQLCGHATLAAAFYVFEVAQVDRAHELAFETFHSGPLYARWSGGYVSVNLPRLDAPACHEIPGLEAALGAKVVHYARASDDIVVELESAAAVASLRPNFSRLANFDCRGHIVTARSDDERFDFVSRSFFPALGVDEDQVCVSAHCKLAPYWATRLRKSRLEALQLSPRGGRLRMVVAEDRVDVAGPAIVRSSFSVQV